MTTANYFRRLRFGRAASTASTSALGTCTKSFASALNLPNPVGFFFFAKVESDETFIGGEAKNMHAAKPPLSF